MPAIALSILAVFLPLSLVTIGGGQSAVADMHRQIVDVHGWMSATQFVDAFAISRLAPGPGSLLATLIGWRIAGFWGALAATIGIFGPTALLIYGVAHIWSRFEGARLLKALEKGLRPVAAGMILAASYVLINALDSGWIGRGLALASTALLMATPVNPLLLIGGGASCFVLLHMAALV
ncbi:MAG: chromate transporter [Bosea sp.]|uniref:chromate transporter n=1 Tax=unclassified Bosea (in: a-proteobacteria) TaxID=2653178 RepID=UPI00095DAAF7|nr:MULTISPECIES: chromate transporter [unclassified Bosea (in: a-proteobacteria)]MBN9443510.1 chromate transporter [Bosea sp. (in: a-proteobacteria)]MBN9458412.1 chromate transporter [Bosea sp. (in: a-proteobacteria)]OJV06880.1 MAG: chromate transporter [Bosea sp. 67-29]